MGQDQIVALLWSVGALVLVGSALAARRLPPSRFLKLALAWLAIFAGVALAVQFLALT